MSYSALPVVFESMILSTQIFSASFVGAPETTTDILNISFPLFVDGEEEKFRAKKAYETVA